MDKIHEIAVCSSDAISGERVHFNIAPVQKGFPAGNIHFPENHNIRFADIIPVPQVFTDHPTDIVTSHAEKDSYRADVSSFHAETNGYRAEFNGYHAEMDGYRAEINGYHAETDGYRADISGYHAEMDGYHAEINGYHAETDGYHAEINGYRAEMNPHPFSIHFKLQEIQIKRRTIDIYRYSTNFHLYLEYNNVNHVEKCFFPNGKNLNKH
jgi:ribosome modulation factor